MYVTATSPYIFMLILLIRNSLLDGARGGVEFYLKPNFTKMADMEVLLISYMVKGIKFSWNNTKWLNKFHFKLNLI